MSLTLLLSTRLKLIESLFGGLDKVYFTHRILGSLAFVYLINHPLLVAIQSLPNFKMSLLYLLPGKDLTYDLGIFSLYLMILAFIFIVFIKLPYHLWKLTHQALGFSFLLGSAHALLIPSDISSFLPLRLWVGLFIIVGLASAVYITFLYNHFGPRYLYRVIEIKRALDIINIYLEPLTDRFLKFKPGQFVYVKFANPKVGSEIHPFSVSSGPNDPYLRLSVKIIGDYTLKLPFLEPKDQAYIYGPYGKFELPKNGSSKNILMIAGGIGIAPFLSMLRSESNIPTQKSITIFGCCRNEDEAVFCEEIQDLAQRMPHLNFINWCSTDRKHLTAEFISQHIDLRSLDAILICGPTAMMEGMSGQFLKLGVPEEKIIFENFSFLSQ